MNEIAAILDQLRQLLEDSGRTDLLTKSVPIAIVSLVAGIGISVLGAKLARPGMTLALALIGAVLGASFASEAGFPAPLGSIVAAAMFAAIAHHTFPMWVGVATAAVFSSVALGTFGQQRVLPHYSEFREIDWSEAAGSVQFAVPTPQQQEVYLSRTPKEYIQDFWTFATQKDASVAHDGKLLGIGAAVAGLFLGVIALRWMLILSTSLVGTALVITGVATVFSACVPGSYEALNHPAAMGMCAGGFMVTSLIVQTLLTRKAPSENTGRAAKA